LQYSYSLKSSPNNIPAATPSEIFSGIPIFFAITFELNLYLTVKIIKKKCLEYFILYLICLSIL
jgi:hypothetical protein